MVSEIRYAESKQLVFGPLLVPDKSGFNSLASFQAASQTTPFVSLPSGNLPKPTKLACLVFTLRYSFHEVEGHDSRNIVRMMSRNGAQDCGMNSGHALKLISELHAEDGSTTYHVLKYICCLKSSVDVLPQAMLA